MRPPSIFALLEIEWLDKYDWRFSVCRYDGRRTRSLLEIKCDLGQISIAGLFVDSYVTVN